LIQLHLGSSLRRSLESKWIHSEPGDPMGGSPLPLKSFANLYKPFYLNPTLILYSIHLTSNSEPCQRALLNHIL